MKLTLISLLLFTMTSLCYAQSNDTTVFSVVDELPTFPGGDSALENYIDKHFELARKAMEQGTRAKNIGVSFIVTAEGKIRNVKLTAPDEKASSFENSLIDVLEKMPDWNPGKEKGIAVNVKYLMEIYVSVAYMNPLPKGVKIKDLTLITYLKTKQDDAYNSGVKKSQEKNYQGAIIDFTEALKYNPNDIDALFNRAVMKFKMKDMEGACADWNSIKALGKNDADEQLKKYCENK